MVETFSDPENVSTISDALSDPEQQCLNCVLCPNIHCSLPTWSGGHVSMHRISRLCLPAPGSLLCISYLRPGAACVKLFQTLQYRRNIKMQERDRRARCLAVDILAKKKCSNIPISCQIGLPYLSIRETPERFHGSESVTEAYTNRSEEQLGDISNLS